MRSAVVVGRERELAELTAALTEPTEPRVRAVLVEGEGGWGKTRLVDEALASVAAGTTVAHGAAYAGGGAVALLPWVDALHDVVRIRGAAAVAAAAGPAAAQFASLVPDLGPAGGDADERVAALLPWLWEQLARQAPLVVVLEDLHAADASTLAVLTRLVRQGRGPLTVVATGRPGGDARDAEAAARWAEAATELARTVPTVRVAPLDPRSCALLVGQLLTEARQRDGGSHVADTDVVHRIVTASGGVPFLVEQLVAATLDGQPVSAVPGDPALRHLPRLRGSSVAVLEVLAAHGGEVERSLLEAVLADRDADDLILGLRESIAAGVVVRRAEDTYAVAHSLVAEQVLVTSHPARVRELHRAIGDVLADRPDDPRAVARLPRHREACGDLAGALAASIAAGETSRYAPLVAARHYRKAVELWDRVPDPATVAGSPYVDVLERAATLSARAGDVPGAVSLARAALAQTGPDEVARRSRLWLIVASSGEWALPASQVEEAFSEAVAAARAAGGENLSPALGGWARHLAILDRNAAAEPLAQQALERAADPAERAYASATLGAILGHLGDHDAGIERLVDALRALPLADHPQEYARTAFELVWTTFYAGRADEAYEQSRTVAAELTAAGVLADVRAALLGTAAQIATWRGKFDLAQAILDQGDREDPAELGRFARPFAAGELALRRGDPARGRALLARASAHWEELGLRSDDHLGLATLAEATAGAGAAEEALALVAETVDSCAEVDTAYEVSSVLRCAGATMLTTAAAGSPPSPELVAAVEGLRRSTDRSRIGAGSVPEADLLTAEAALTLVAGSGSSTLLAQAAQAWARLGAPWWEARCRLWRAESLLRTRGARTAAAPDLETAGSIARELGAAGLAREAERLAAAAGIGMTATGRVEEPDAVDRALAVLTAREREVLGLLTEGLSNRQIAARLFISEKTASVHVSNILAKLGVSSRLQAAALALRTPPDAT